MEFNSFRKWMTILVTDVEEGNIKLYIKGADSEILKWLADSSENNCSLIHIWQYI
jgi:magnesium-transporting ATPase (P-type)